MLAGQVTLSQTVERIQARTRQFAKRQATWFRGLEEVRSINVIPPMTDPKRWPIDWLSLLNRPASVRIWRGETPLVFVVVNVRASGNAASGWPGPCWPSRRCS